MEIPKYEHPPITEAVIGIFFSTPLQPQELSSISNRFKNHYKEIQNVSNFNVALGVDQPNNQNVNVNVNAESGFRLSSEDMTELLLLWPSAFLMSQLAPYKGWDSFFERFKRNWEHWKRIGGFRETNKIAMRYINRVDIPIPEGTHIIEHEEYFNIFPNIPKRWPALNQYALQTITTIPDSDLVILLNSSVVEPPILNHVSFVIDIDISKSVNVPQNDDAIFDLLKQIRDHKNEFFEDCITDKTRGLFS